MNDCAKDLTMKTNILCMINKRRLLAIRLISAGIEPMKTNKLFTNTNLPRLKIRLIMAIYVRYILLFYVSVHLIIEKILNHTTNW